MAETVKTPHTPARTYRLRADTAPEAETVALRNVYRYLIDRAKSRAAENGKPDAGHARVGATR